MPRYQYACPDCGNQFEVQQKFTDKPLKKCPTCGRRSIHRVVGLVAVSFKGTGFYVNDSKNGSSGKTTTKPEGEETKVEAATDAKPEAVADATAKPDAKADGSAEPVAKPAETTTAETKADSTAKKSEGKAESKPASSSDKKSKHKS